MDVYGRSDYLGRIGDFMKNDGVDKVWIPQWFDNACNLNVVPEGVSVHVQLSSIKLPENLVDISDIKQESYPSIEVCAKSRLTEVIDKTIDAALVLEGTILDGQGQAISTWTGSAFLIQPNIAITNSHTVVEPDISHGEKALHIVSADGEDFYEVRLLARDESIDISVFEIVDFPGVSYLSLGDSDAVDLGEMIIVLGAPEGWENNVNVGYVSNKGQSIESGKESWQDLIFIDAFIANGSSGGAVVDINGQVVGVVIGIIGRHSSIGVGVNAIIPVNKVKEFLSQNNILYQE